MTKNWVTTAIGKIGKEGVVVDHKEVRNFVPSERAPVEKEMQPELPNASAPVLVTSAVSAPVVVTPVIMETSVVLQETEDNIVLLIGETLTKEEEQRRPGLQKKGDPSSAPGGIGRFVATRRDILYNPLPIEEIISPLKDLFEVSVSVE
ncbi:unnamed protein product [Cochlearia groenlandica]